MRGWIGIGAFAAVLLVGSPPAQAASLIIHNAVVKVTVIPEDRSDIVVKIIKPNARLPLTVQQAINGDMIVDGSGRYGVWAFLLGGRTVNCRRGAAAPVIHVWGVGDIRGEDMPQILVKTPMDARISSGGAAVGSVGRAQSLDLQIAGCDDWTLANVAEHLLIEDSGIARVRAGSSGSLALHVAGFGAVKTADVADGLVLHIAGVGRFESSSVSGPVEMHIAGHGDVKIGGGHATSMDIHIAGSGVVDDRGQADRLKAEIAGTGTVNLAKVAGPVTRSILGVGSVNIGP